MDLRRLIGDGEIADGIEQGAGKQLPRLSVFYGCPQFSGDRRSDKGLCDQPSELLLSLRPVVQLLDQMGSRHKGSYRIQP